MKGNLGMNYLVEVDIADTVDDEFQQQIEHNLNDGTLTLASLPNTGTILFLKDGVTAVMVECAGLLQKEEFNADGLIVVRELPTGKSATKIKARGYR